MTDETTRHANYYALCLGERRDEVDDLVGRVTQATRGVIVVEGFVNVDWFRERMSRLIARGDHVVLVIVDDQVTAVDGPKLLDDLGSTPEYEPAARMLLVSEPKDRQGIFEVARPWSDEGLAHLAQSLVTVYFVEHAPEDMERIGGFADTELLSVAYTETEKELQRTESQLERLQRSFFVDAGVPDDEVEQRMIDEIDRALSEPERVSIPVGTVLLRHGQTVDRIWIVLDGEVRLTRTVDGREIVLHLRTAGRIVGLMAVARNQPAFMDATAATDLTAISLTLDELDRALRRSETLAVHFVTALLRSMVRRHQRSIDLRIQVDQLNLELARERDQLAAALAELERTQTRLIESEKMATLGQLVAGIGHELNNPIAAIGRAADFITEDLSSLPLAHVDGAMMQQAFDEALHRPPISTAEERHQRNALAEEIGDRALAGRLVSVGITDPADFQMALGALNEQERERRLLDLERYHQLGLSLRNIRSAAGRIGDLVGSLRSYARAGQGLTADVDVSAGIEDTLLLLGHELRGIDVEREYGEVARIACIPGQLNQVWTNLIHNAIRAMDGSGTLTVRTSSPTQGAVRVEIEDTGPGIDSSHIDQIFDMHFTTAGGRVDFGLGLGLRLAKDIVTQHGGSIEVESEPGRTCFAVTLPPEPPEAAPGES
jgi:signal transduction histidine kinase